MLTIFRRLTNFNRPTIFKTLTSFNKPTIFKTLTSFNKLTILKNFSIFNRLTIFKKLAARILTPTGQHLALLFGLGCLLYFSGNASLAVTDPVESNYTETAAEMLASGNYL
jgi:hypothetical protein